MYFVLFVSVILLLILSYHLFGKDVMHPAVFLCMFFAGAIIFGFYLYKFWHLYEFGGTTTAIFCGGISAFIIGSAIAKNNRVRIVLKRRGEQKHTTNLYRGRISVNQAVIVFAVILSISTMALFFIYYRTRISSAEILKKILEYKASKNDNQMIGYLNFLIKTLCAMSNCFLFIFINNSICKKIKRQDVFLLVPAIIYCFISLLSANRGNILILIFGCFAAWYILYHRINGWEIKITGLFLSKGFRIATVVLPFFWAYMVVVRNKDISNVGDSFMTYVCSYFSGPLASFDMYLKQGGTACEWWGQETFVALNNNLNSLFGIGHTSTRFLEFRYGFGYSVVNIYSSFRRFYHDFGFFGVALLSGIQGYITSKLYYAVKRKQPRKSIDLMMVIYCYYFYTVPYILVDELFYSSNISISGLGKTLVLIAVYKIISYGLVQEQS